MGLMWMLNIVLGGYPAEMNAVFVVNLVTSLGFGVEFCNHIAMNFLHQRGKTREERAMKAMNAMGSSVVVGIASTKFLGVMVLAFAPSTLFKLYYFRMYMLIIILGVFNGLFFLPVLLRLCGPAVVSKKAFNYFIGRERLQRKREGLHYDEEDCGSRALGQWLPRHFARRRRKG
jgi:Niemann-Pick C1 protein